MFDLGRYVPYLVNRTGTAIATAFSRELLPFQLNLQMWRVLAALWHADSQRLGDLAQNTDIEVSTLSRLIGSMQSQGHVSRVRSGADARAVTVTLTKQGRSLTERLIPIALRYEAAALQGFTHQEAELLRDLLERVRGNMGSIPATATQGVLETTLENG